MRVWHSQISSVGQDAQPQLDLLLASFPLAWGAPFQAEEKFAVTADQFGGRALSSPWQGWETFSPQRLAGQSTGWGEVEVICTRRKGLGYTSFCSLTENTSLTQLPNTLSTSDRFPKEIRTLLFLRPGARTRKNSLQKCKSRSQVCQQWQFQNHFALEVLLLNPLEQQEGHSLRSYNLDY